MVIPYRTAKFKSANNLFNFGLNFRQYFWLYIYGTLILCSLSLFPLLQTMATVSSKAVGPMGSLTGPGANRASVLRAAYQQQYKMKFAQASSSTLASTSSIQQTPPTAQSHDYQQHTPSASSEAAPPPKKKRKSRWD